VAIVANVAIQFHAEQAHIYWEAAAGQTVTLEVFPLFDRKSAMVNHGAAYRALTNMTCETPG